MAVDSFNTRTGAVTLNATDVNNALSFTPENTANKKTTGTLGSSTSLFPAEAVVKSYVDDLVDGEDLELVNNHLRFKNYLSTNQALKRIIIRSAASFANLQAQFTGNTNCIFEIRYEHDFGGTATAGYPTLTIPANSCLYFNGGLFKNGIVAFSNTYLKTPFLYRIFDNITFTGNCLNDEIYPEYFGAKGDGSNDDTAAIRSATLFTSNTGTTTVKFTRIKYKVTEPLFASKASITHFCWQGVREEKGHNSNSSNRYRVNISYEPASTVSLNDYMIILDGMQSASPNIRLAPPIIKNLSFLATNGGNILKIDSNGYQSPVLGTLITDCSFFGKSKPLPEYQAINITLENQYLIHLDSLMEHTLRRLSVTNGTYGIYLKDNDDGSYEDIRLGGQFIPIYLAESKFDTLFQRFRNIEIESSSGAHIVHAGQPAIFENCHLEQGSQTLTTLTDTAIPEADRITCATTAYSNVVVFTASMTNVLFPNVSVLRLTYTNGEKQYLVVKSVSDKNVTVYANNYSTDDTYATTIFKTASGISVERVHSQLYVNIEQSSYLGNISFQGKENVPVAIVQTSKNDIVFNNCDNSNHNGLPLQIVNNRQIVGTYPQSGVVKCINNARGLVGNTVSHPFCIAESSEYFLANEESTDGRRFAMRGSTDHLLFDNKWQFTTKNMGRGGGWHNERNEIKLITGEEGTSQTYYAWYTNTITGQTKSITSEDCYLRIKVIGKAETGSETVYIKAYINNLTPVTLGTITFSTALQTYELIVKNPFAVADRAYCILEATTNATSGTGNKVLIAGISAEKTSLPSLTGVVAPDGNITAPPGTIYLKKGGSSGEVIYVKQSGTGNTGWFNISAHTTTAVSADNASAPGSSYSQTEVQSILTELRDLKTKMRAAGLLAS
ncbi:hypothetical protein SAMN05421788_101111 [Filimonas lacunae]|uniref:Pectate lyase superfamily protein n=1 Tax=Filimonas lacunae TaxID=477680 RepID=A0A173MMM2_9BACT|nr:hypothetical protein [Filimonas lacunae]BAV08651.1 hypothetical protein FLA_4698 [Filimonas lacunae]SIS59276.1 hypothetical protein SAMN05421788_101111 [Filimonas lacunae]